MRPSGFPASSTERDTWSGVWEALRPAFGGSSLTEGSAAGKEEARTEDTEGTEDTEVFGGVI